MRMNKLTISDFEKFIETKELICADKFRTTQFLENKLLKGNDLVVFGYEKYTSDGELYVEVNVYKKSEKYFIDEAIKEWKQDKHIWKVERFKDEFPIGCLIRIIDSQEPNLELGTVGRVGSVEDNGLVHMLWSNGCKACLNIDSDVYMRVGY